MEGSAGSGGEGGWKGARMAVMETLGDGMRWVREFPFSPMARGGADRRNETGRRIQNFSCTWFMSVRCYETTKLLY